MQDLTQGSIPKHIIRLAIPMAAGMLFQTMYYFIDLYFVSQLGDTAIAGVSAAGNVQFIVMSLTQILGVGTMVLISHASGRKDRDDANLVFNQSVVLALVCALTTLVAAFALSAVYLRTVAADAATVQAGTSYLYAYAPGLALQFALVVMGSALRGTGIARPGMIVQMATVVMNAVLAPVLIAGWFTHRPLGVAGAGLASSISILVGVLLLLWYFMRLEKFVGFHPSMLRPRVAVWTRLLRIGLPAGGEFGLMFVNTAVIYWIIRDFGATAQAGYGVGTRVMQGVFLPAMALSFAAAPVAGQNVGAGLHARAAETFRSAALIGSVLMFALTLLCQWRADVLVKMFAHDAAAIAVGSEFLHLISWNFVATGIIFTCSGMFQALGNTIPALISSATRVLMFALPAIWLSSRAGFELHQVWILSVSTVIVQMGVSLWLLRRALEKTRRAAPVVVPQPVGA